MLAAVAPDKCDARAKRSRVGQDEPEAAIASSGLADQACGAVVLSPSNPVRPS